MVDVINQAGNFVHNAVLSGSEVAGRTTHGFLYTMPYENPGFLLSSIVFTIFFTIVFRISNREYQKEKALPNRNYTRLDNYNIFRKASFALIATVITALAICSFQVSTMKRMA